MEINTQPGSSNVCRLALERREVMHNGKACRSHLPTCVERPSPAGRSRVLPDLQRARAQHRGTEALGLQQISKPVQGLESRWHFWFVFSKQRCRLIFA